MTEPKDHRGQSLGVRVYEAYCCTFGFLRNAQETASLSLTVDLRAKIARTMSVLDHLCQGKDPTNYHPSSQEQMEAKRHWISEVVITMHDKRCHSVVDLDFEHSASTLPVKGLGMSHAEYFEKRKGTKLRFPDAVPMVVALGRNNLHIFLPPELVAGNDLGASIKQQLPFIASFGPEKRNKAIEKIREYLVPGAQTSNFAGGLLPALGIQLHNGRLAVDAQVLPIPQMVAAGIEIPKERGRNWAMALSKADFRVNPGNANTLNVVLVFHERLARGAKQVYEKIRDFVNEMNSTFRLGTDPIELIRVGTSITNDYTRALKHN